jgi:7-cyano-7-deazaguanine synthase
MKKTALVLLSGGQDSSTSLFWAKKKFRKVEAVSFDYGHRHIIELKSAAKIAKLAGVRHTIIKIKSLEAIKNSALTDRKIKVGARHRMNKDLPSTFVPGRNMLFLAVAASFAYAKKIKDLVIGVSQVDYSGYPDCRMGFMKAAEKAISLGMGHRVKIHTPLIKLDKKNTVLLAKKLGVLHHMKHTHTCYRGTKKPCGTCPACKLRAKGFEDAGILDALYNN